MWFNMYQKDIFYSRKMGKAGVVARSEGPAVDPPLDNNINRRRFSTL